MTSGAVFWFTGLSGAGKTTIADEVRRLLEHDGLRVAILDGDAVREGMHRHLGFSEADIKENNRLIAELCATERERCDVILVPIISPYAAARAAARARLGNGFYEIYVSAGLDTVTRRDTKGLYAAARRGEIDNLIGVSPGQPYEIPASPDLAIDSGSGTAADSAAALYRFILEKCRPTT